MRCWLSYVVVGLVLLTLLQSRRGELLDMAPTAQESSGSMIATTQSFLGTLDAVGKQKCLWAYGDQQRVNWQFVPLPTRKGLPMMEMSEPQQKAARQLLQVAVSQIGYEKATKIMSLESVLRKLEGPNSLERRNPLKYYFTVYGTPGATEHWGLSIEGHHLSLNFVLQGDKIVDSTPQFFASNPAELKDNYGEGFEKGLRVLRDEETLAFELFGKLNAEQRKAAMLPGKVPSEIRAASEPQPPQGPAEGVSVSTFSADQKDLLKKLLLAYTDKMRKEVAEDRWQLIERAGLDKVSLAWSGADKPGVGHYYRVQGPSFLIEFINVQADAAGNPANHIHCVWRDMTGDFDIPVK